MAQNAEQLKRYSDRAKALLLERSAREPKRLRYAELLRDEGFNIFHKPSTLVAIAAKGGRYTDADGSRRRT